MTRCSARSIGALIALVFLLLIGAVYSATGAAGDDWVCSERRSRLCFEQSSD